MMVSTWKVAGCLILGMLAVSPSGARAAADAAADVRRELASPLDGATLPATEAETRTPVEGPRTGAVGESSGVFHMGASGCNAWVIDRDHVMTNNHCVDRGGVKLTFYRRDGKIEITNCQATPVARSVKLDYAVFKCAKVGEKVPPVRFANREPRAGEAFTLVTHDLERPGQQRHARGKMGAPVTLETGGTGYETLGATVISGNSGSVIYDEKGEALGLIWGSAEGQPKTGVMSSLRDVIADVRGQTSQVAFHVAGENPRMVADARPGQEAVPEKAPSSVVKSDSEEPATLPARSAPESVPPSTVAYQRENPEIPSYDVTPTASRSVPPTSDDSSSALTTVALIGAAAAGVFLVYKFMKDREETDRKYAAMLASAPTAVVTTPVVATTETTTAVDVNPVVATQGPVSKVLQRDSTLRRVAMPVRRLGAYRLPYLRPDYLQRRPTSAMKPSRKLKSEAPLGRARD